MSSRLVTRELVAGFRPFLKSQTADYAQNRHRPRPDVIDIRFGGADLPAWASLTPPQLYLYAMDDPSNPNGVLWGNMWRAGNRTHWFQGEVFHAGAVGPLVGGLSPGWVPPGLMGFGGGSFYSNWYALEDSGLRIRGTAFDHPIETYLDAGGFPQFLRRNAVIGFDSFGELGGTPLPSERIFASQIGETGINVSSDQTGVGTVYCRAIGHKAIGEYAGAPPGTLPQDTVFPLVFIRFLWNAFPQTPVRWGERGWSIRLDPQANSRNVYPEDGMGIDNIVEEGSHNERNTIGAIVDNGFIFLSSWETLIENRLYKSDLAQWERRWLRNRAGFFRRGRVSYTNPPSHPFLPGRQDKFIAFFGNVTANQFNRDDPDDPASRLVGEQLWVGDDYGLFISDRMDIDNIKDSIMGNASGQQVQVILDLFDTTILTDIGGNPVGRRGHTGLNKTERLSLLPFLGHGAGEIRNPPMFRWKDPGSAQYPHGTDLLGFSYRFARVRKLQNNPNAAGFMGYGHIQLVFPFELSGRLFTEQDDPTWTKLATTSGEIVLWEPDSRGAKSGIRFTPKSLDQEVIFEYSPDLFGGFGSTQRIWILPHPGGGDIDTAHRSGLNEWLLWFRREDNEDTRLLDMFRPTIVGNNETKRFSVDRIIRAWSPGFRATHRRIRFASTLFELSSPETEYILRPDTSFNVSPVTFPDALQVDASAEEKKAYQVVATSSDPRVIPATFTPFTPGEVQKKANVTVTGNFTDISTGGVLPVTFTITTIFGPIGTIPFNTTSCSARAETVVVNFRLFLET